MCEDCGVVTIRFESLIRHDVERSQFAREADQVDSQPRHVRVKSAWR